MQVGGRFDGYKMVAPDIDRLLNQFDRGYMNPSQSTPMLQAAVEPLFQTLLPLASIEREDEAKSLWLRIPRGTIEDYDSYEDMKDWGEVESREEYEACWLEEYPEEYSWYRLVAVRSYEQDGALRYFGVSLGNKAIVSALTDAGPLAAGHGYLDEAACCICTLILPAVQESMRLLAAGNYNSFVDAYLPYKFRVGVIRRTDMWEVDSEAKEWARDGLSDEVAKAFRQLVVSGANDEAKIGRMQEFTANDFFAACKLGYESIGRSCDGMSLSELYLHHADGRDEGLTGKGCGLNAGPGIDFDDPEAWYEWYFHRTQRGGHPWEVVRGGNSTHVELYVRHDKRELGWKLRAGLITQDVYEQSLETAGWYFAIAGKYRPFEAINFYVALSSAGLPVVIWDAEALLARLEGSDWVGVVPHHVFTRYCESLFPEEYKSIIDFTHVYKAEDAWFDRVVWLPEVEAKLC